jgi:hypothetical protein
VLTGISNNHIVRHRSRVQKLIYSLSRGWLWIFLVLISLGVFYTRAGTHTRVYASASNTLNFQARLLNSSGAIVADGSYSVQFKLYAGSSGGAAEWTETQSVSVRAGYLSVYLGSSTAFPGTIDWSQQQWLTMNVSGDGEMSPRLLLTAVPNALHSNETDAIRNGGNLLTANDLAQLGPSSPQAVNLALAALRIDQTGSGGLLQLQHNGGDTFTVANTGDLVSSGNGTFSGGMLDLGAAGQSGGLVLQDGAGHTGTIQTATLGTGRTYTLPDEPGTICIRNSLNCGFVTTGGLGAAFVNGGNSFGGNSALGNNDNFSLTFRTNNTNQLTLDTSGNLNFLAGGLNLSGGGITNTGLIAGASTIDASGLITGVGLNAGTGSIQNTGGLATTGSVSINGSAGTNTTNIGTGTTSGQITIGGGSAPLVIDSANFDVSSSGALSGITTINSTGVATISGGAIISGAAISLNDTSNFNTSINTGTSSGTVTIGGGSAPLVIDSTNFDVSSAGALSGITTISASGNINTSAGVYQVGGTSGITVAACTAAQYIGNGVTLDGGIITAGSCHADGVSDQRLKTNVVSLDNSALDKINQVNAVNFDFKCDDPSLANSGMDCNYGSNHTGVIAQQLAQIFPGLVFKDENGYYNVRYQELSIYTLKALQQLSAKFDSQTASSAANLNPNLNNLSTGSTLRLDSNGVLQNITGLQMISGSVSVAGGINNNGGGLTNTGTILGATRIDAESLGLHATGNSNFLTLTKDNNGVFTVFNNGALEIKLDANNAFAVKKSSGDDVFSVNTSGGLVQIGGTSADDKAILLVLDSKNTAGDPAGVNGAQYYNSSSNKFRCYQNNQWQDCLQAANAEFTLITQTQEWPDMPASDTEFPSQEHTWVDLTDAREFRIIASLSRGGNSAASCRLQYAVSDDGPWAYLGDNNINIGHGGSLKSDWKSIGGTAHKEVLIRVVCNSGGSGPPSVVGFNNVKLQVR